jgi:gluconate kinase
VKVLVISGSMGAGKTTVLGEASTVLRKADVRHAAIDLDHLSEGHYVESYRDEVMLRNLTAMWANYAAAGATRALVCKPIDTIAKREQLEAALPGADIVVCRLRAALETMQSRVRARELGSSHDELVAHVAVLEDYLDAGAVEDFCVDNDNDRPVVEVAHEVLTRAGWL